MRAILHGPHSYAHQPPAKHAQAQHHAYNLQRIAASPAHSRGTEENQGEYIAEEQSHAVPQSQQQVHADLSYVRVQHGLIPQLLSGQFDEDVFEGGPLQVDVFELQPFLVDPLDQIGQGSRRPRRMDHQGFAIVAERMFGDGLEDRQVDGHG